MEILCGKLLAEDCTAHIQLYIVPDGKIAFRLSWMAASNNFQHDVISFLHPTKSPHVTDEELGCHKLHKMH